MEREKELFYLLFHSQMGPQPMFIQDANITDGVITSSSTMLY